MIPTFNHSHVLPPFVGERLSSASSSPYRVSASALVQCMSGSVERTSILAGLFRYRSELKALGFARGFQWLDGSFIEDIESREGRPPNDIDVVTFAYPPVGLSKDDVRRMLAEHPELFDHEQCKAGFHCDTSLVNLTTSPEWLVMQTRYWYGLFSHRRGDALWKGMLELPLDSDDETAVALLHSRLISGGEDARAT
jgi:hypothetical protein